MQNDKHKRTPTEEAYAEVQQAYDFYNEHLFGGQLPHCMITFQREKTTMGYFSARRFVKRSANGHTDELALNPEFFAVYPMMEILQTLVHEMVHLWQHHFGKPSRACYHNTEWADKMESLGLMPSATGAPGGKRTGQKMMDYIIPGGPMETATKKLLVSGFAITWLDRFPVAPPSPHSYVSIRAQELAAEPPPEAREDQERPLDPEAADAEALYAAALAMPSPAVSESMALQIRGSENRSNRDKYTCPGCSLSVWGKPKLRLKCVDCDRLLEAATGRKEQEHAEQAA